MRKYSHHYFGLGVAVDPTFVECAGSKVDSKNNPTSSSRIIQSNRYARRQHIAVGGASSQGTNANCQPDGHTISLNYTQRLYTAAGSMIRIDPTLIVLCESLITLIARFALVFRPERPYRALECP
jgi:hypothetical protein